MLNAAISPDGKYLGYADQQGIHLQLVETGSSPNRAFASRHLSQGKLLWAFGSWFPDSTRFVASVHVPGRPSTVWSIPIQGGEAQKLAEVEDMFGGGTVSPDGSNIAYQRLRSWPWSTRDLVDGFARRVSSQDSDSRKPGSHHQAIAWSPAGNRLAYSYQAWQRRSHGDLWFRVVTSVAQT